MPDALSANELFWECADYAFEQPGVTDSTIFGFRCLRVDDQFVAMPADDCLWVKLPEQRVEDMIDSGQGESCAPNGRVFREWLAVRTLDESLWRQLIDESIEFVRP